MRLHDVKSKKRATLGRCAADVCMAVLGSFLMHGIGTEKNPEEAFKRLHFAHERRNSYATMRLGDYYYLGMGTTKNLKKALEM